MIIDFLAAFFSNVLEYTTFFIVSGLFLQRKTQFAGKYSSMLIVGVNTVAMFVLQGFTQSFLTSFFLCVMVLFITTIIFYRGKLAVKLFCVVIFTLFSFSINIFLEAIVQHTGLSNFLHERTMIRFAVVIAFRIIIFVMVSILRIIWKRMGVTPAVYTNLSPEPVLWLVLPVLALLNLYISYHWVSVHRVNHTTVYLAIALLGNIVAIFALAGRTAIQVQIRLEQGLTQQYNEITMQNINRMAQVQTELSSGFHDYFNQMRAVRGFIEQGCNEKALEHLQNISGALYSNVYKVRTHNIAVDLMISDKECSAQQKGICFQIVADDCKDLPMSSEDIVAVVGNVLDNAIEATEKLTHTNPVINIKFSYEDGVLVFSVINPVQRKVDVENIITTKTEPQLHGVGLKSVAHSLKKYGGSYALESSDKEFQFTAMIDFNVLQI